MLPHPSFATKLLQDEPVVTQVKDVTFLCSDIEQFTSFSATRHPQEVCHMLNQLYTAFDQRLLVKSNLYTDIYCE